MAILWSSLGRCDRPLLPVSVCGTGPDVYTAIIFVCCTPDIVTKGYFWPSKGDIVILIVTHCYTAADLLTKINYC